jgi:hypothetical protein
MRNPALDVVGPLPPDLDPGRYHRVPFRERERLEGSQALLDSQAAGIFAVALPDPPLP